MAKRIHLGGRSSRSRHKRRASRTGGSRRSPARKRWVVTREHLERAAAGLLYSSESDYPLQFFSLPCAGEGDLTPAGFLVRLGVSQQFIDEFNVPIDRLVEERPLDGFFPSSADLAGYYGTDPSDPKVVAESKRFRRLEAALRKRLKGVRVLRVGYVEIRCYIVGRTVDGDLAGLVTTAIET
jgi:hypothetical protein